MFEPKATAPHLDSTIHDRVEPTAGPAMAASPDCDRVLCCSKISRCANFRLPHALQATLLRRVVPAPQRCATHFL